MQQKVMQCCVLVVSSQVGSKKPDVMLVLGVQSELAWHDNHAFYMSYHLQLLLSVSVAHLSLHLCGTCANRLGSTSSSSKLPTEGLLEGGEMG